VSSKEIGIARGASHAFAGFAVAAVALALLAAGALGSVKKGATYRGATSEHETVTFKVSSNGRNVLGFTTRLGYNGKCGEGGGPSYAIHAASIKLRRDGRFQATTTGTLGPNVATVTIIGRISGKKAGGVVEKAGLRCSAGPYPGANGYRETFLATAK
jgi:hypothetical protein